MAVERPPGHYTALPQRDAFRLLTLLPGEEDEMIRCALSLETIPDPESTLPAVVYEAVSYAWGTSRETREIQVDAWLVPVGNNLWHFLKQQRRRTAKSVLWIDAICIDQSKLDERAEQVQMMARIFKGARQVLVWLGVADSKTTVAMDLIYQHSDARPSRFVTAAQQGALDSWAKRGYWTRAWVVQEFVIAKRLLILCGPNELPWARAHNFIDWVAARRGFARAPGPDKWAGFDASPAARLMKQRAEHTTKRRNLLELLILNRQTSCLDARDRVYAMLGLALDTENRPKIYVSYQKPAMQLIEEVIEHCHVPTENVIRVLHFLLECLAHKPDCALEGQTKVVKSKEISRNHIWTLPAWILGDVVKCTSLGVSQTRDRFANLDADRLRLDIFPSQRVGSRSQEQPTSAILPHQKARRCSIDVYFAARRPQVLSGVATGSITKGDRVVMFLGHDVAIAITSGSAPSDAFKITGLVLLQKTVSHRDMITGLELQGFALQSELDYLNPTAPVNLRLSFEEMVALAC